MDGINDLEQYSRIPTVDDLVTLCRNLNQYLISLVSKIILVQVMSIYFVKPLELKCPVFNGVLE